LKKFYRRFKCRSDLELCSATNAQAHPEPEAAPQAPIKSKPPALKARFINSENGIDLSRAFSAVMLLIRFLGRLPQASRETPPSAVAERNVTNGIATLLLAEKDDT
jgi:hypothetical protein